MDTLPQRVQCVIAGGGPAGMLAGLLLAREGVSVLVLEKHADFLRDFRGDTVHPSTLEIMHELGVLDEFLKLPHQKVDEVHLMIGGEHIQPGDFKYLGTKCKFIALMPQWDFLDFLAKEGKKYPGFHLAMSAKVTGLLEDGGKVVGLKVSEQQVRANLVIGADGRHSAVRELASMQVNNLGAPIDVLWYRLSKKPSDPSQLQGFINYGRIFVMIDRGDYWQCASVIRKGGFDAIRARGLDALKNDILRLAPFVADRMPELTSWDDVQLLSVTVDRLEQWWKPGLLCIGDAAHAMSPIGGVGINLAIQDAVAAANILAEPLRNSALQNEHLQAVQDRRMLPTRFIQRLQVNVQNGMFSPVIGDDQPVRAPWILKLFNWIPILRFIPARILGVGIRPEHLRNPAQNI